MIRSTHPRVRARSRAMRLVAPLLLLAGLGLAQATWAPTASAHDVLIKTSPADGATVGRVPERVVLTFDEPPIEVGAQVRVTGPKGDTQDGRPVLAGRTVRQAIAPGSPAGDYTVRWRVTSDDGHPVSGTFRFSATRGSGTTATAPAPGASSPTAPASGGAAPTAPSTRNAAPTPSAAASAPATTPTTPATATSSDRAADGTGGSALPWIVGAIVLVVLLGGGLVAWGRSRA